MAADELLVASAVELRARMEAGEVKAVEVAQAHLDRIAATDDRLGAWLTVTADRALAQADAVDQRRAAGEEVGALAGVPVAVKDIICTEGVPTTAGSRILEGFVPPYDATVVQRLKAADAVILGKTNLDEFAMGSSTENSAFNATRNPWHLDRVPGGSSGGSSAAVAAFHAPLALGTDTGGSIRQPASLCGLVGIKPTYGRVSRYGLIAFASSLDQCGTFGRTVRDAVEGLEVLAGHDPRDSTSIPDPLDGWRDDLDRGPDGLRVGVVAEWFGGGASADVEARCRGAIDRLAAAGAEVLDVSLPHAQYGLPAYYLIAPSEASANLSRYDGVRYGLRIDGATTEEMMARTRAEGFGPEVRRRVMIGTYALSAGYYDAYYAQAQRVRTLIVRDFTAAFERCDVLVGPTCPTTAFPLGEKTADPLQMYLNDVFAVPASMAGLPALSVPVGLGDDGLPVGLQVVGGLLQERSTFRAAAAVEASTGFDPTPRGPHALAAPGAPAPSTGGAA